MYHGGLGVGSSTYYLLFSKTVSDAPDPKKLKSGLIFSIRLYMPLQTGDRPIFRPNPIAPPPLGDFSRNVTHNKFQIWNGLIVLTYV